MANDNSDDSYKTGYGKPPRHTQFKKGQSGNPKGRPKGSKNISTQIREAFNEKVLVNTPQGPRYVTKMTASLTQWANKAAGGNMKAIEEAVQWNREIDERAPLLRPPDINIIVVDSKRKQNTEERGDK